MRINSRVLIFSVRTVLGLCLLCPLAAYNQTVSLQTAPGKGYVSQTYIDTLVLNALYVLDEAVSVGGPETRRRIAIEHAKSVVGRLRHLATKDPNRSYILFKAAELESQIFLEESGLLREDAQRKQAEALSLINTFNAELGRKRPNFIELQKIHAQMSMLNPSKANELIHPITDRQRNISREVMMNIEAQIQKGNYEAVRSELDYCDDMQGRLAVSTQRLRTIRLELQSRINLDDERREVARQGRCADSLYHAGQLGAAQDTLQRVRRRLDGIRTNCPPAEFTRYESRIAALLSTISRQEDSLITAGLSILEANGIYAAVDYAESLKRKGINPIKIARIDREIVERAVSQVNRGDERIGRDLEKLASDAEAGALSVEDLTMAAKRKAQQRADSLRAEEERRELSRLSRRERRKRLQNRHEQQQHEAANREVIDLYTLMEQGRLEIAVARFKKTRKMLKKHLCAEAYSMLLMTLDQSASYNRQATR